MGGAELWSEKTSPGESYGSDGADVASGGMRGMWGVGVVSESDCVIWMAGGLMEEEVGLGGSGRDGSTEEEAGCAVLSSGEWNIDVPIVFRRWNVAGRPGCLGGVFRC